MPEPWALAFCVVIAIVGIPPFLVAWYFYIAKRHEFPFVDRMPWNLVIVALLLALNCVDYCSAVWYNVDESLETLPSWQNPWYLSLVNIVLVPLQVSAYALKSLAILIKFKISEDLADYQEKKLKRRAHLWKPSKWTKIRRLPQKLSLPVTLTVTSVYLVAYIILSALGLAVEYGQLVKYIFLAPSVFLLLWVVWMLNKCGQDNIKLKEEMKGVAVCGVGISCFLGTAFERFVWMPAGKMFFAVGFVGCVYSAITWPLILWVRQREDQKKHWQGFKGLKTFTNLLEWKTGSKVLMQYLLTEFSSENLLFWNAAGQGPHLETLFKGVLDCKSSQRKKSWKQGMKVIMEEYEVDSSAQECPWRCFDRYIKDVNKTFMGDEAPQEVNIPQEMLRKIESKTLEFQEAKKEAFAGKDEKWSCVSDPESLATELKKILPFCRMYDPARDEIRKLMEKDSFTRFQRSQLYQDLMKTVPEEKVQDALQTRMGSTFSSIESRASGLSNMSNISKNSSASRGSSSGSRGVVSSVESSGSHDVDEVGIDIEL